MKELAVLSQIHGEKCWPSVDKISPCEQACPLHTDVPSYIMAIAQGKFQEALTIIRQTNPLPSICGRVCHHPCEEKCNRLLVDKPIAIKWLKRAAVDYGQSDWKIEPAIRSKEAEIAIVGSGPAGLTAAHDIAREGYSVTIFEALPVAGGMLMVGIPDFALPRDAVQRDIDSIKALGVKIKTGTHIGSLDELTGLGFKAILLATGAHQSARLKIPGSDLKNIHYALPLLKSVKLGESVSLKGRVVVIGGGNVAIDAARTAIRLGANKVALTCLESREQMPAYAWEIEAAEREGVEIQAALAPQSFSGDGGRVAAVEFRHVAATWISEGKVNWSLKEGSGSELDMPAEAVIIAIGQSQQQPALSDKLELTNRGAVQVDPLTLETSISGIFAAGDAVGLPGTVTESMAAGRKAAAGIMRFLNGDKSTQTLRGQEAITIDPKTIPSWFMRKERVEMPKIAAAKAAGTFNEVDTGYTPQQAMAEAQRCLNCWMCADCIFERDQLCFETGLRLLSAERR